VKTNEEKDEMSRAIITPATTLAERKSVGNDNTNGRSNMFVRALYICKTVVRFRFGNFMSIYFAIF
jgi:hypothetical protein